jgi:hypothetical protein
MHLEFKFFYKENHLEIDLANPEGALKKYIDSNFLIPLKLHWGIKPEGGLFVYGTLFVGYDKICELPDNLVEVEITVVKNET